MDRFLETFDAPFTDDSGEVYTVEVFGRLRNDDAWEGWLVFARHDGLRLPTPVETTQSSADAILYWARGLSSTYFDGAFVRAKRPAAPHGKVERTPLPLRDGSIDAATYLHRLSELEQSIITVFQRARSTQLETRAVLDALPHANADVIRALEDLEKQRRLLVRQTESGNDWLILTEDGVGLARLDRVPTEKSQARIDPPQRH